MTEEEHTRLHLLVQADHDGELSVAEAAELAAHVEGCAECRAIRDELSALSARLRADAPRHTASAALRASLEAQLAPAPVVRLRPRPWRAIGLVAGGAMAMAASIALFVPPRMDATGEMVASHIRALQPGHLIDVASMDQHTVKPWFDGRIDYAPPVRDFSGAGFPLIGGRLDYLEGRAVAALVYRHDKHIIDLYVWPATGEAAPKAHTINGYNVVAWVDHGMRFQAVSDLNSAELEQFAGLWRQSGP